MQILDLVSFSSDFKPFIQILLWDIVTEPETISWQIFIFSKRKEKCVEPHPSRHDGIDISRVTECQSHEVGVQRSDSLKHQPDVAGGGKVQQGRGGVICTGPTIDQRRVDL